MTGRESRETQNCALHYTDHGWLTVSLNCTNIRKHTGKYCPATPRLCSSGVCECRQDSTMQTCLKGPKSAVQTTILPFPPEKLNPSASMRCKRNKKATEATNQRQCGQALILGQFQCTLDCSLSLCGFLNTHIYTSILYQVSEHFSAVRENI